MCMMDEIAEMYTDPNFQLTPTETEDFKYYDSKKGGHYVPRVTKLLGTINEPYLLKWANSLGYKHMDYNQTLNMYAEIGSEVHKQIELYLKTCQTPSNPAPGFISFRSWWAQMNILNTITDIQSEVPLVCEYFGGTADLLFNANGHYCLTDFKTSNNIGYKYVMQLAAYKHMIENTYGIKVDYCFILQVDKYKPDKYTTYIYDFSKADVNEMFLHATFYMVSLAGCYLYNTYMQRAFSQTKKDAIRREAVDLHDNNH